MTAVGRGWKGTKTGQGRAAHIFPLLCFYSLRLTGNALRCFRERFLLQEKLSRLIIKPENREVVGHDRVRFLLMFLPDHSHFILLSLSVPYSLLNTQFSSLSEGRLHFSRTQHHMLL